MTKRDKLLARMQANPKGDWTMEVKAMNRYPRHRFEVRPLPEKEGGGWLVTFPDLPGCMADGESVEQAVAEAADAEESWLRTREELGVPEPSGRFVLRLPKSLHARLTARARQEGVSMNTLAVSYLSGGMEREGSRR